TARVPGVRESGRHLGPPADLPGVRGHGVLRRLAQPPRHAACANDAPSRHRLGRDGRALAVLLSGRRVRRVLTSGRRATILLEASVLERGECHPGSRPRVRAACSAPYGPTSSSSWAVSPLAWPSATPSPRTG